MVIYALHGIGQLCIAWDWSTNVLHGIGRSTVFYMTMFNYVLHGIGQSTMFIQICLNRKLLVIMVETYQSGYVTVTSFLYIVYEFSYLSEFCILCQCDCNLF